MNSLKEYGELFLKLNLSELSIQEGNFSLVLRKDASRGGGSSFDTVPAYNSEDTAEEIKGIEPVSGIPVKAPLLGIFEELSGGRTPIKEGDAVKKCDALCTIEAMKMQNDVVATADGIIERICAKPGDLVEYNQELFIIK